MPTTEYAGIDYGLGTTNIDRETGIRFGVINQNEVLQAWADSSEADYGPATCAKCGNQCVEYDDEKHGDYTGITRWASSEFACETCKRYLDGEDAYGDEPCGWTLDDGEYKAAQSGGDGDILVVKSPYYARVQFCSPCAPGAGYLATPCSSGPKAYCFGPDWFDDDRPIYDVYDVATGRLVCLKGQTPAVYILSPTWRLLPCPPSS